MANKPRGRSALSFHVSNLGFAPGETLPSGTVQPQPIYPVSTACIFIFRKIIVLFNLKALEDVFCSNNSDPSCRNLVTQL